MNRLIALDLPASDRFVAELDRVWSTGDAVFPLDQRLSVRLRHDLARQFGASRIVGDQSVIDLDGGATMFPDEALVIATSGSTGSPKGVVHTHASLSASARASASTLDLSPNDRWLVCIPVSHIGGFSVITRAQYVGSGLVLHESFDASRVEAAARAGCTHVSLVPTALRRIDASLFRRILLGGQAAPPDLPPHVTVTYGSTETGGGIAYDGKALPDVELRIVNDEIQVRTPSLFARYLSGDRGKSADGWFRTGDAGLLVDGQLVVTGRLGDLIISGGENIWPQHVERALRSLPDVDDVAVVGLDDPQWGQRVAAFLETARNVTLDEVRDVIVMHLPSFCVPKSIHCMKALPRTSSGKVDKQALISASN